MANKFSKKKRPAILRLKEAAAFFAAFLRRDFVCGRFLIWEKNRPFRRQEKSRDKKLLSKK